MKAISGAQKRLAILLAASVLCGLFTSIPITSRAASDETELAAIINHFDPGNGGPAAGQLTAAADTAGRTVTVTGAATGVKNCLMLNIASDITVIWEADYYGWTEGGGLVDLDGEGVFEVAPGGALINYGPDTTLTGHGEEATIRLSGGTVEATGSGCAIYSAGKVEVYDGRVASAGGLAIGGDSASVSVTVNGGTVIADTGNAIHQEGACASVTVSGGAVRSAAGHAIRATGLESSVTVSGGTVSGAGGGHAAVYARNVYIHSFGRVEATGSGDAVMAIGRNAVVSVSGGAVSAAGGFAILTDDISSVTISGGFVFSAGSGGAVRMFGGTPAVVNLGIVCTWTPSPWPVTYIDGTSEGLTAEPAYSARWSVNGAQCGILYVNGMNVGFYPIPGLTVVLPQDIVTAAPAIAFEPYLVRVTTGSLNIRKGPGTDTGLAGVITDKGIYTIVDEADGPGASRWGRLKSGAGWISLDFTVLYTGGGSGSSGAAPTPAAATAAPATPATASPAVSPTSTHVFQTIAPIGTPTPTPTPKPTLNIVVLTPTPWIKVVPSPTPTP